MKYIIKRNSFDKEFVEKHTINNRPDLVRLFEIFSSREVTNQEETLPKQEHIPDPFLMKNMDKASEIIAQAIVDKKKICIVADYDTDGASACAVAWWFFHYYKIQIIYLVPNRFTDGYGLSVDLIDTSIKYGVELIITVDNGIGCVDEALYCKEKNIPLIITDHHLPGDVIPDTLVINPNQTDCPFPSKNIAGVGVIWFVFCAVNTQLIKKHHFSEDQIPNMYQFLDIVTLGTISDLVTMDKVNRALVSIGLNYIREQNCSFGIQAIAKIRGINLANITTTDVSFFMAPVINAAGRMATMQFGIECLIAPNYESARQLAKQLIKLNNQRHTIQSGMEAIAIKQCLTSEEIQEEIDKYYARYPDKAPQHLKETQECLDNITERDELDDENLDDIPYSANIVFHEDFHIGIIGIIAARLSSDNHRPSIIFTLNNEKNLVGSCRSIPSVNSKAIFDKINEKYPDLIDKHGGHSQAAGITLKTSDGQGSYDLTNFEKFKKIYNYEVFKTLQQVKHDEIIVSTDGSLGDLFYNYPKYVTCLTQFIQEYPWGKNFELPRFDDVFEIVSQNIIGNGHHLELILDFAGDRFRAIYFNQNKKYDSRYIHAVYTISFNKYRHTDLRYILLIKHVQKATREKYLDIVNRVILSDRT